MPLVSKHKKASKVEAAPAKKVKKLVKSGPVKKSSKIKAKTKVVAKKAKPVAEDKLPIIKSLMSKTELYRHISEQSDVEMDNVKAVMGTFEEAIMGSMDPKGAGEFMLQGFFKITTRKVPARKAGVMVRNPATGEMMKGKAKPASLRLKIRPLAKVKRAAIEGANA